MISLWLSYFLLVADWRIISINSQGIPIDVYVQWLCNGYDVVVLESSWTGFLVVSTPWRCHLSQENAILGEFVFFFPVKVRWRLRSPCLLFDYCKVSFHLYKYIYEQTYPYWMTIMLTSSTTELSEWGKYWASYVVKLREDTGNTCHRQG